MNPLDEVKIRCVTTREGDQMPMICIDGPDFQYSRMVGMYTAKDGVGFQVAEGADEEEILELCDRISSAVRRYYLRHVPTEIDQSNENGTMSEL